MKQLKYIILPIILSFAVILTCLPAYAVNTVYDIWINGTRITADNAESGIPCGTGKAYYSADKNELTLENISADKIYSEALNDGTVSAVLFAKCNINVKLSGSNKMSAIFCMGQKVTNCGIYCTGDLTFTGTGSLSVTGGLSTYSSAGIYTENVYICEDVTVETSGGTFTGSTDTYAYGIFASGNAEITNNAKLTAGSYKDGTAFIPEYSYAVYIAKDILTVNNAHISAYSKASSKDNSRAVYTEGTVMMYGGTINAVAAGQDSAGLEIASANGTSLSANSGSVFASGEKYAVLMTQGGISLHPDYKVTGSAVFNDLEKNCTAATLTYDDNTCFYEVRSVGTTKTAKTVYLIRPLTQYDIWVDGIRVTNYNYTDVLDDGKVSYAPDEKILTLNGATINKGRYNGAYIYAEDILTIDLVNGTASSIGTLGDSNNETSYGIYCAKGINVTGGGSVAISAGNAVKDSFGIYVRIGSFVAENCRIQAKSGNCTDNSIGIYTASKTSGNMSFSDIASVSGYSGKATTKLGICSNSTLSVESAASAYGETATGTDAKESYGVRTLGDMSITNSSSVTGISGSASDFSIGVFVTGSDKGVTVNTGKLTAIGGGGANSCYGIYAKCDVTVKSGEVSAISKDASDASRSLSYALTCKNAVFSGGTITADAGNGMNGSCGIYSDRITLSGSPTITASSGDCDNSHAMRKAPQYVSFAPVVYAGKTEPGEIIEEPKEATYVNSRYVKIEKRFRSEKIWYALPIYDASGHNAARWIGFSTDNVEDTRAIANAVELTGAAEYYNGYIYGITASVPFRFWRAPFDGVNIGETEIISESVRFSFGDMSYDYVTNTMYGLGTFNDNRALFKIDTRNGNAEKIAVISGTADELLTLAFSKDGTCYGIDLAGYLYTVSTATGIAKKIGFTGLVPDGAQSMAFDKSTDELFWAYYNGITKKSGFYNVDTETGKASLSGRTGGTLMELTGLFTIPKQYDIWIGGVRINEENCHDVFGNGLVTFEPDTKTVTFNAMKITTFTELDNNYSFGILVKDTDINLVFNGDNAIALNDVKTKNCASICVLNGDVTISGGKIAILNTTSPFDTAILCTDNITLKNTEMLIYSAHNGIAALNAGADIKFTDANVTIKAIHAGVMATAGGVILQNSTVDIESDMDSSIKACAVFAYTNTELKDSTLKAKANTNVAIYSTGIKSNDSITEAYGAQQAFSVSPVYGNSNGASVATASESSGTNRVPWDGKTELTSYKYVYIGFCEHTYSDEKATVCDICGTKRPLTQDGEPYTPGDVNGDGNIDSSDARLALRISVALEDIAQGSKGYYAADADFDGSVTSSDARLILRASVNLETIKIPQS